MASLKQPQRENEALNKKKVKVTQGLDEVRSGEERAEYERDGLVTKLQRTPRECEKCVDAINRL